MPKYRDVYLEQGKTLADSGTHTIDISPVDPISQLMVNIWATNGATSNKDAPIARIITKIEVIDGADTIFSMDGRLAHALYYYMSGNRPQHAIREEGTESQSCNIPLMFGRWLWDPQFALDPTRFRNLQLKVSWNLAAVRAVGATGFLTGSAQLSVIAKVMEGLEAPPAGFMMSKNHYSWTTGASGDERIALPSDYPYVLMMLRAWESGVSMTDSITNFKLNIDFDKYIPLDIELGDLINRVEDMYGTMYLPILFQGDSSENHELWVGDASSIQAMAVEADRYVSLLSFTAGRYQLGIYNNLGVAQTAQTVNVDIWGLCPWNCVVVPMGVISDPATYLMAPEHGDIKAVITQGNAGAEADVVLTQLRGYAAA